MFNKTNLMGWANLAFRLLLSLGLVFIVQHRYGTPYVKPWLVYITLIASIHAADGLISQYFMREILHARAGKAHRTLLDCYRLQRNIYLLLALACAAISFLSMGVEMGREMSIPIFLFAALKIFDSRTRAYLEVETFQKLELMLNGGIVVLLGIALFWIADYRLFPLAHLAALTFTLAIKSRFSSAGAESLGHNDEPVSKAVDRRTDDGLWKSLVIAFGGSLSINLALLALQSLIGDHLSASYLLTYRIGALICEVASVPLIVRIPAITRLIAEGDRQRALAAFQKNYWLAMLLCVIGFMFINLLVGTWNDLMPRGLHLEAGSVLVAISASWILERIATLKVQLQLSLKKYAVVWVYGVYVALGVCGLFAARKAESPALFSWILMVANMIVAAVVTSSWRRVRVE